MHPTPTDTSGGADPGLAAGLDGVLPASLPAGSVSAALVTGWCFHRSREVRGMRLLVDGEPHEPTAWGTPRPALVDRIGEERAARAGVWGLVSLRAREPGTPVRVEVEAELEGGETSRELLADIEVTAARERPVGEGAGRIAVCMATYEPDPELFARQVGSLRSQTDEDWVCLISDDRSSPEALAGIEREVGSDPRFVVSPSPERIGFYRNFERALEMVPADASLVALCDQDDTWYPNKLAALRAGVGDSVLVYADQRRVDRDGGVIAETLWASRRRNHTDFTSMLVANTIVGASSLFRRELLDVALPFPEGPGWQFHDHWLSVCALAVGPIAYVDRPLYDYVQHTGAIVGRVGVEERAKSRRLRLRRGWAQRGRAVYFRSYEQFSVQALAIVERAPQMVPEHRRAAERLLAADRSIFALLRLALRPLRELLGRNETLGTELHLAFGLFWRRAAAIAARFGRPVETELPPLDLEGFDQRRLKRWLAGG